MVTHLECRAARGFIRAYQSYCELSETSDDNPRQVTSSSGGSNMLHPTGDDFRRFTEIAQTVRTPDQAYDLARSLSDQGASDYSRLIFLEEHQSVTSGDFVADKDGAKACGVSYPTARRRRDRGEYPKPDRISPQRIAMCRWTLLAFRIQLLAWNDLQHKNAEVA